MSGLLVVLALTIQTAAQVIPTDGPPPGPRTGMIVGQVVDAATGAPVAEAIVRLAMPKYSNDPTTPKGRVMADGEGRFFFADLPAGDYYLQAIKDGYAHGEYGQRRAWSQSLLLSLGESERLSDVKLRVWKYAVIAGTVVDEAGEPVVGIAVRALIKDVVAGRTQFGNTQFISELVPSAITDDRGMFSADRKDWTPGSRRVRMTRPATDGSYSVKGLPPGAYFLAAPADLETGDWNDPVLLEQLASSSARVILRAGETTRQGFRIGRPLP